jgi:DNA polymerase elongation subunit (family B)
MVIKNFKSFKWEPAHTKKEIRYHVWAFEEVEENQWKPVLLRLLDAYDEAYIVFPLSNWSEYWLEQASEVIRERLGRLADDFEIETAFKTEYYYYHSKPSGCLRVISRKPFMMRKLQTLLIPPLEIPGIPKEVTVKVEELQINPIRKLLTSQSLNHCSYLEVDCEEVMPRDYVTNLDREYDVYLKTMREIPYPAGKPQPRICIGMFDFETYSPRHNCLPESLRPSHEIYLISYAVERQLGLKHTREAWVLTSECPEGVELPLDFYDEAEDSKVIVHVIYYPGELELIRAFEKLIVETDIDILGSYNGHEYDIPYLKDRLECIHGEALGAIGRLADVPTEIKEPPAWKSSAYGSNAEMWFNFSGRVCVDLLKLVKRQYKLRFYNLAFVTDRFLKRAKIKLSASDQFKIYESGNAQQWDTLWRYSGRDAVCLLDLFDHLKVWVTMTELSNVTKVSLEDLYTRGQQIRVESCIYDVAYHQNFVITKPEKTDQEEEYEGALVQTPLTGLHGPTFVLDFSSLYPSIMIQYNISHDTYICPGAKYRPEDVIEITVEENGNLTVHRWLKPSVRVGMIPQMLMNFLSARKSVKEIMKELEKEEMDENRQMLYAIYNSQQEAFKVTANSFYGFLGAQEKGRLPLLAGASCVTAKGRDLITKVADFVRDRYQGTVRYGDTDSVMVGIPNTPEDLKEAMKFGKVLASEVTKMIDQKSISITFENIYHTFLLFGKKMYIAVKVGKDGQLLTNEDDIVYKGVSAARREHSDWVLENYKKTVRDIIVEKKTQKNIYDSIDEIIRQMLTRQIPKDQCVIVKNLGSYDADSNYMLSDFMKEEEKRGRKRRPGERIGMIICRNDASIEQHDKIGSRLRSADDLEVQDLHLDTFYYINNNLRGPFTKLLETVYKDQLPVSVRSTRKRTFALPFPPPGCDKRKLLDEHFNEIIQPATDSLTHVDTWVRLIQLHDRINSAIILANGRPVKRVLPVKNTRRSTTTSSVIKHHSVILRPAMS